MKIFFIMWPSLYQTKRSDTGKNSTLDKQRSIVGAILETKRRVHTDPVHRYMAQSTHYSK